MKTKSIILAILLEFCAPVYSAQFIVSNVITGDGSSDALYAGRGGGLHSNGIVAIGYFPQSFVLDYSNVYGFDSSMFTIFGTGIVGSYSPTLGGSFPGYVEAPTVQGPIINAGNPLIGRPLYVFYGYWDSFIESYNTSYYLMKQIGTIQEDTSIENKYFANPINDYPVFGFGYTGTYTGNASGRGVSTYTTISFVPEPSSLLLGALGAIGLFKRRRK